MGKVRIAVPAAFALALLGFSSAPGTRATESPPARDNSFPGRATSSPEASEPGARQAIDRLAGDFNGDAFSDLAVGVPTEDLGGAVDGGGVNVVFGSATGLVAAGNQWWSQDSAGVGGAGEHSDQFGSAAATGDFNADGFDDLAVGVPLEDPPEDSGVVNVLYGSATGLNARGNQIWSQDSGGIRDRRESEDQFGRALAAGDFNHDGADDLAVGVPFERVGTVRYAGGVNVIYGSPAGLDDVGNQYWTQGTPGIAGKPEKGDTFGSALMTADFNGDTFTDLAVGSPWEDRSAQDQGVVHVIYGSPTGLSAAGNELWGQDQPGIAGRPETHDLLGYALAAADFDDDGFGDLALGVPFEDLAPRANAGGVNVIYGTANGLRSAGNQLWTQNSAGIVNTADARDEFGFALTTEDFNGDLSADLAIGVPGEDPPGNAGAVAIIYGRPEGLRSVGNQLWTQEGLGGSPSELWDTFAFSLAAGRFDDGNQGDLVIGVPAEDVATKRDAGAVNVAYGSPDGLRSEGNQYWTQDDLAGPAERGDRFGYGLGMHPPS